MLILEAVIGEMHHQLLLVLKVLLIIVLNSESQVPSIKQCHARGAIVKQVASDIKLLLVDQ